MDASFWRAAARGASPRRSAHAVRWFPEQLDLAAAERKYGPRIDGTDPVRVHVALIGGWPAGFAQHYRVADFPHGFEAIGELAAAGLDYAIGNPGLTGRGLGPQLIWSYLQHEVLPARPRNSTSSQPARKSRTTAR